MAHILLPTVPALLPRVNLRGVRPLARSACFARLLGGPAPRSGAVAGRCPVQATGRNPNEARMSCASVLVSQARNPAAASSLADPFSATAP